MTCDCGAKYADFRTGLTFGDIRAELWSEVLAGARRHITRHTVLGRWREHKLMLWGYYHGSCTAYA